MLTTMGRCDFLASWITYNLKIEFGLSHNGSGSLSLSVSCAMSLCFLAALTKKFGFNDRAKKNADFYAILHTFGSIFNYRTWYLFFSRRLFCLISRPVSFHLPFLVISFSFSHTTLYVKWKSCSKNIRHIAITKCGSTHSLRYIVYYTTYMHDRVSFFCSVSHRFFAVVLLSSFVFYRRRRHTNEACDIRFFLPNLTALW